MWGDSAVTDRALPDLVPDRLLGYQPLLASQAAAGGDGVGLTSTSAWSSQYSRWAWVDSLSS